MKKLLVSLLLMGSMYGAVTPNEFVRLCANTPYFVPSAKNSCYTVAELYVKTLTGLSPLEGVNAFDVCFELCTNPILMHDYLNQLKVKR